VLSAPRHLRRSEIARFSRRFHASSFHAPVGSRRNSIAAALFRSRERRLSLRAERKEAYLMSRACRSGAARFFRDRHDAADFFAAQSSRAALRIAAHGAANAALDDSRGVTARDSVQFRSHAARPMHKRRRRVERGVFSITLD
jgi:hypothetical protein